MEYNVKDYLNDILKRGKYTEKALNKILPTIHASIVNPVGKELLMEDICRLEDLYMQLIKYGFGPEKDQINDDDLVEMRYLKKRISSIAARVAKYYEIKGEQDGR